MTEQDIDFESLPSDIKDKLAELELELSEGKFIKNKNRIVIFILESSELIPHFKCLHSGMYKSA